MSLPASSVTPAPVRPIHTINLLRNSVLFVNFWDDTRRPLAASAYDVPPIDGVDACRLSAAAGQSVDGGLTRPHTPDGAPRGGSGRPAAGTSPAWRWPTSC